MASRDSSGDDVSEADRSQAGGAEPAMQEQGLIAHLVELRSRLLRAIVAVLVVFGAAVPFRGQLYTWLAAPLLARLPAGAHLVAIDVSSPFLVPVKLCFFAALTVAMPVVIYQLWAFVAPGLYKHEKRLALPLLVSATTLFYTGCAFAYFVVLPMAFRFLVAVTPAGVSMMTDIGHYLDFVGVMFIAFGASFELPVALVILVLLGWVTPAQLANARPYAILGNSVVAALITPPDAVSMLMLAIPLCLLYEVGLLAAKDHHEARHCIGAAMNAIGAVRSPAGFWKRYVAYFIDIVLVWLAMEVLSRLFFPSMGTDELGQLRSLIASMQNPEAPPQDQAALLTHALDLLTRLTVFSSIAYVAIGGAYFALFESSDWQATPGKRLVGIRVVDADGSRIGRGRAIGRFLAAGLSWLTMNIGHALAACKPEYRALHDYLASTYVENVDPSRPGMPLWGWLVIAAHVVLFVLLVVAMVMATLATINAANQF